MELLLELQDMSRFRRAEHLAAYVGLTPSQYSSADKVRMSRIIGIGKNTLRAILVEASWKLIIKDQLKREKYERNKSHSGGKRAITPDSGRTARPPALHSCRAWCWAGNGSASGHAHSPGHTDPPTVPWRPPA
jgi:transposase